MNRRQNIASINGGQKEASFTALTLCALFVSFLLFATLISARENHAHDTSALDGACAACASLESSRSIIKSLSLVVFVAALAREIFSTVPCTAYISSELSFTSLVCLKVRSNM
ncbi:MAG: hypothetical protein LBU32_24455 [Clostridiales bacterium]|nr:hypothetical protein [Clostridiales bacterium]